MFVSFCWRIKAFLWNSCTFQRIICIWDKIGYHGNHCEGFFDNLRGVYPSLVNIFWSFLDLISTEQCLFQCVQLHVWQWFMYHFRLKCGTMYEFCMTFWPFSLPIMSMWSFFISPRLTLIPFRMHFESCWYNLSDSRNFVVLFMYVPVNLMYLGDISCHGNHCEGLLTLNYNYDWCSPKPCDYF